MSLCTLDQVKLALGIDNTDSDVWLQQLIDAASAFASTYCGRTFEEADYDEIYDGPGGRTLLLRQTPVTAVSSVNIDGISVPISPDTRTPGYTFTDISVVLRGYGYLFCQDLQNVAVSYTAGYVTIPADLSEATVAMVVDKYRKYPRIGTTMQTIAGETVMFKPEDMPAQTKSVYQLYQRAAPL